MKKVFYLVAASMLMTSCLKDRAIEAYNEDFASVFGDTDPLHTWKMVDEKTVEVNVEKPSRVKIYVKVGDTYRLAADYENVLGTRTLAFDAPMGCEDIHVTVDGAPIYGADSRAESRADVSPVTKTNEFKNFTYGQITTFHNDGQTLPEKQNNTSKLTSTGCRIISNGEPYRFYPIYWGGIFYHTYGLYYYDANKVRHEFDFYDHKVTDCLQYKDANDAWQNLTADYAYDYFFPKSGSAPAYDESEVVLKSRCYTINLPAGTEFGFYVDITHKLEDGTERDRGRFYSDPELNDETQTNKPFSAFAYLHQNNDTQTSYVTIEDYDDSDYNDFIFLLEGQHTHVVDEPVKYMYAVEDLGSTNDFDFNDIVFTVSHVKGKENATVQPMAAGGIYPATIYFGTKSYGEIHSKFGVETNVMVNTKAGTTKNSMIKADPFLVKVGTEWSHTAYGESGNGFSVKVEIPNRKDKVVTTYVPGEDAAPQMLVLAENWLWPTEKTRISDAYTDFGVWGANYKNQTWVKSPTSGLVVNWR